MVSSYCAKYGSPKPVYYGSAYHPRFAIFDGEVFVKFVDADIGLIEANGRTSFRFNMSASDAGCHSKPPSFKYGDSFPANYKPCYRTQNTISQTELSSNYEIFNATNRNSIIWQNNVNGIYLFSAQILDPEYSFCKLSTTFAIKVEGAPSADLWQILLVLGFNIIGILILAGSFFWYSHSRKQMVDSDLKQKVE